MAGNIYQSSAGGASVSVQPATSVCADKCVNNEQWGCKNGVAYDTGTKCNPGNPDMTGLLIVGAAMSVAVVGVAAMFAGGKGRKKK